MENMIERAYKYANSRPQSQKYQNCFEKMTMIYEAHFQSWKKRVFESHHPVVVSRYPTSVRGEVNKQRIKGMFSSSGKTRPAAH